MNTPKTAALWELLREMGWSEDQRPVSFIMQSHAELEEELAEVSKDYRCLAELLDGHDATECRANLVRLKESLAAETARADEQFALAMEIAAKLETERALADRLAHWLELMVDLDADGLLADTGDAHSAGMALAAYKAARNETKS